MFYRIDLSNGGPATANTSPAGITALGRLPIRASNHGVNNRLILNGLKMAYAFDEYTDYPAAAISGWSKIGTYVRDLLGSAACLVAGANPPGQVVYGGQTSTVPVTLGYTGIYLGAQYAAQFSSGNGNCTGVLPISGNAAFTVQMIVKPDGVAPSNGQVLFELMDPAFTGTARQHRDFYLAINAGWEGGVHLDAGDVYGTGFYLQSSPSWSAGNYYLLTLVKTPGIVNPSNVKLYVGKTPVNFSAVGTQDGQAPNLSSSLKIRLGCWGFGQEAWCDPANTGSPTQFGGAYSFFSLYDRALSVDEVARNYAALKTAMAQPPRSVALQ